MSAFESKLGARGASKLDEMQVHFSSSLRCPPQRHIFSDFLKALPMQITCELR